VMVQQPTKTAEQHSHKVDLIVSSEILALYRRRKDVIDGRIAPRYAGSSTACTGCAFRSLCDRPRG
jgi:CRISPR-associated exonuclease Cas4